MNHQNYNGYFILLFKRRNYFPLDNFRDISKTDQKFRPKISFKKIGKEILKKLIFYDNWIGKPQFILDFLIFEGFGQKERKSL